MFTVIDSLDDLAFLNEELLGKPYVGVDTEFRRTTKDNMRLALLQINDAEEIYLVDTVLINDPKDHCSFLFSDSVIKVFHSCKEDIEIAKFYKSPSDKTRDGHARVCIPCVKENVAKHYELRKQKEKNIPDFKECSAVPEVGLLSKSEFRNMSSSNTGLQPQCSVF